MRGTSARVGIALASCVVAPRPAFSQSGVEGVVYVRNAHSAGAVVYVITDSAHPPIVPSEPVVIDQRNLHFLPDILPVLPGQAVAFRNSDPLLHNVFSPDTLGEAFDLGTYPEGEWRMHTFQRPGAHVILCHIHPEMEAHVVVIPTRHYGVVDAGGRFRIENVPPGTYPLHVWHRRAEPFQRTVRITAYNTLWLEIQLERRGARARHRR